MKTTAGTLSALEMRAVDGGPATVEGDLLDAIVHDLKQLAKIERQVDVAITKLTGPRGAVDDENLLPSVPL